MSDRSNQARAKHDQGRMPRGTELLTALALSLATPAFAADSVKINDLVVAVPIPDAQREAALKAVRAFYDFWNTGDEALLKEAVAPNFTDHTLPPGRPKDLRDRPSPHAVSAPPCPISRSR